MPFPLDPNAPGGPSRSAQLRQAFEPREAPAQTICVAVRTNKGSWHTHVLPATDPFEIARGEL
jgi:hypothetical protein